VKLTVSKTLVPEVSSIDHAIACDHESHRVCYYDENLVKRDVSMEL